MEAKFQVKMTGNAMYQFLLYHTYTKANGIGGLIIGLGSLGMVIRNMIYNHQQYTTVYAVFAFVFLLFTPVYLRSRAEAQVKKEMFQKTLEYEITKEGVRLSQGEESYLNPWDSFEKVRETGGVLILYMNRVRALVIPKECMKEQETVVKQLIRENIDGKKIKMKAV